MSGKAQDPEWLRECPKCHHLEISIQYCPAGVTCPAGKWNGEHMDRQCQQCGYRWTEPCAKPQPAKPPREETVTP